MVSINENTVVIPGERLGSLEQYTPGNGTYIRHGYVYASLAGFKQLQDQKNGEVRKRGGKISTQPQNIYLMPAHAYGPISHAWLKSVRSYTLHWNSF